MSTFQSSKVIPSVAADLETVAQALESHFRQKGFDVTAAETVGGSWHISIHKGGLFKAALGMKTALNVTLESVSNGTLVNAGIGIFGLQAVPAAIMWFIFWPVLITQIWGIVQQTKLDDEAVACVEQALTARGTPRAVSHAQSGDDPAGFCTNCGKSVGTAMKFCSACGHRTQHGD